MTLREFLDAGYALVVEMNERASQGIDLLAILEKTAQWAQGAVEEQVASPARQNDAALAQLKTMMAGTGRV